MDVELPADLEEREIVEEVGQQEMPGTSQELVSRTLALQSFWLSAGLENPDGRDKGIK